MLIRYAYSLINPHLPPYFNLMSKMDSENEYIMKIPSIYFHERIRKGVREKRGLALKGAFSCFIDFYFILEHVTHS